MSKAFEVVRGIQVAKLEGIEEGYCEEKTKDYYRLTINVSAQNIDNVFTSLCKMVRNPGFLLLEFGTNAAVEKQLRKSDTDPLHIDIHYLDGLNNESFLEIYQQYKELLVHDGMINFGFGSHHGMDEIYVGKYKIFTIYTDEVQKYYDTLSLLGIPRVEELKTVWNNISEITPGRRSRIIHNGMDIYQMVELLTEKGLYFAERRED